MLGLETGHEDYDLARFILSLWKHHQDFRVGDGACGLRPGTGACCLGSYFSCGGTIRTLWLGGGHED